MLFNKNNRTKAVFEVKKKHSWRGDLIRVLEISLILVVVLGTIVWFLIQSNFSFSKFIKDLGSKLQPKVEIKKIVTQKNAIDTLKTVIEGEKVFEIESIKEVQNGFEVRSKNSLIVVFAKDKDFSSQVTTLQTLLAKAKIDNKSVKRVDFRFEKIIVQY